jgi:hypothetical protein
MARLDAQPAPLTPYERAACYYTLPRIAPPMPAAFVFLYGGLLSALLATLCIVAVYGSSRATYGVVIGVVVVAFSGMAVVMVRSTLAEVRTRRVLQEAHDAPNVETQDDSLPDPFANHILMRHATDRMGRLTACTSDDHDIEYFIDNTRGDSQWILRTPQDQEMMTVLATGGVGSFAFVPSQAQRFTVYAGGAEIARIQDGGTLLHPQTDIVCYMPTTCTYTVKDGGIHFEGNLVGRVYFFNDAHYLDIEREHLNDGTLGYFVSRI